MPLIQPGIYIYGNDKSFEVESAYYLNFQILSALFSMNCLFSENNDKKWTNKYQYYHFYSDHLLYSVGQIANRFVITGKDKDIKLERKLINRTNYRFDESSYPILSDKRSRNMIEHIDEYNQKIILEKRGVGGFNLIDNYTDLSLITIIRSNRDTHPYTLDLLDQKLLIRWKTKNLDISLVDLKSELVKLQNSVKSFESFL